MCQKFDSVNCEFQKKNSRNQSQQMPRNQSVKNIVQSKNEEKRPVATQSVALNLQRIHARSELAVQNVRAENNFEKEREGKSTRC